jgi:hypothetical protein
MPARDGNRTLAEVRPSEVVKEKATKAEKAQQLSSYTARGSSCKNA